MFLRNQFKGDGVFEIPKIKKEEIKLDNIELIGYDKLNEKETDRRVIPTVAWGEPNTFWFCFDGIEKGTTLVWKNKSYGIFKENENGVKKFFIGELYKNNDEGVCFATVEELLNYEI